jgi:membrane protein
VYQVVQWVYIAFQIGVTKANAIYGSFAALPLFLVWLQTSWLIVLFGAEIAYAHQNDAMHEYEPDCETASVHLKRKAVLLVLAELVRSFVRAEVAPDAETLAARLSLPIRLVRRSLAALVHARLVAELAIDDGKERAYQPAEDVDGMTFAHVFSRLEHDGTENIPLPQSATFVRIESAYEAMLAKVQDAGAARVRDLV